jgi:hypothetical protein
MTVDQFLRGHRMENLSNLVALGFMSLTVLLRGLAPAFPHASNALLIAGDTSFQLSLLASNPQAALGMLSKKAVPAV